MPDQNTPQEQLKILKCLSGHHFLSSECPVCNQLSIAELEYRAGDCIACGSLCGAQAYCCDRPRPIAVLPEGRVYW